MCGSSQVLDRVLGAEPLQHRVLPELLLRRPELDRLVGDLLGVVPHRPVELGEGRPGVQRIGVLRRRPPASAPPGTSARSGPRCRRPRPCCAPCACPARPASRSPCPLRLRPLARSRVLPARRQAPRRYIQTCRAFAQKERHCATASPVQTGDAVHVDRCPTAASCRLRRPRAPRLRAARGRRRRRLRGAPARAAAAPRRDRALRRRARPRRARRRAARGGAPPPSPPAPRPCAPAPRPSRRPVVDPAAAPPPRAAAGGCPTEPTPGVPH